MVGATFAYKIVSSPLLAFPSYRCTLPGMSNTAAVSPPVVELTVLRQSSRNGFTPGQLLWAGVHECFTCEDVIREVPGKPVSSWKVQNETAIPAGRYRVKLSYSPHFRQVLPEVIDVPGYTGIRIHIGNTAKDTDGCLLLGETQTTTGVASSTAAFGTFMLKLSRAIAGGEVWIKYVNPAPQVTS